MVAVRGDEPPVIVELKRAFGIELLLQGVNRQSVTDAVYLAIPKPKRDRTAGAAQLCRRLGLGLLVVAPRSVEALVDPAPYRPRRDPRRRTMLLKEFARRVGDTELGGSAARRPRMTAYRQDALRLAAFIAADGARKWRRRGPPQESRRRGRCSSTMSMAGSPVWSGASMGSRPKASPRSRPMR